MLKATWKGGGKKAEELIGGVGGSARKGSHGKLKKAYDLEEGAHGGVEEKVGWKD